MECDRCHDCDILESFEDSRWGNVCYQCLKVVDWPRCYKMLQEMYPETYTDKGIIEND